MIVPVVLFLVLLLGLVWLLWPLAAAWGHTRPRRRRVGRHTPADWGLEYEDVTLSVGESGRLAGWYVPSRNGAAVALLHGHGGNRLSLAFHARTLARAGYGVLLFDLRAHGDSSGYRFAPAAAIDDVSAAVAWLARRRDVLSRVGLLGVGAGGALAIQAAARNAFVRGVVADNPTPLAPADNPPLTRPAGLWRRLRTRLYWAALGRLAPGERQANGEAVARLAGRPLLLIAGDRQSKATRYLYGAAPDPKRLWCVAGAAPATGWHVAPAGYAQQIVTFFDDALSVAGEAAAGAFPTAARGASPAPPDVVPIAPPIDERTVAPPTALMVAFATIPVAMMALVIPMQLRWGLVTPRLPARWPVAALLGLFAALLAGLFAREVVQWAAYRRLGGVPHGAVRRAPGHSALGPRLRCETPLPARVYRLVLLLPALLLGLLPAIIGIVVGSWLLLLWGLWLLVASSGDLVALWAMRDLSPATPVRAHPRRPGCEVFSPTDY